MAEFIKNGPFRFWCQKVLPLVYDDSLSYYELLCKVVCKLNELAENQNNLSDEIKQVAQDLNNFKNQVPGMIEAKVQEWLDNYIATHGLVNSVNGMTGVVTLTAADVGAIANVNGSVKNNNIADGAVTAEKIADGVIPEKLPNPQKLTFTGAVTGEYDGSQVVNINIPSGGGGGGNAPLTFTGAVNATYDGTEAVTVNIPNGGSGGGAVDSVNGMTGAVVLKKLTAGEGLSMSGEDGYNGSAEQSVGIAPGGVSGDKIANGAVTADKIAGGAITSDKMASGVIPEKLPNPQKLTFTGGVTGTYDGSEALSVNVPKDAYYTKIAETSDDLGTKWSGHLSIISDSIGVLWLRAGGTARAGKRTLVLNMTTGVNSCRGTAVAIDVGSYALYGAAVLTITTNAIDVTINLSQQCNNIALTIPFVKIN